jgi:hypothetical protein
VRSDFRAGPLSSILQRLDAANVIGCRGLGFTGETESIGTTDARSIHDVGTGELLARLAVPFQEQVSTWLVHSAAT